MDAQKVKISKFSDLYSDLRIVIENIDNPTIMAELTEHEKAELPIGFCFEIEETTTNK